MNVNILSNDVLVEIFTQYLNISDLVACRKVCVRWNQIVDSCDGMWKHACSQVFGEGYQEAYDRSCLSWPELYTSLDSMTKMHTNRINRIKDSSKREIKHQVLARTTFKSFEVLQNGIICVPQDKNSNGLFDTIVHYDLNSLNECYRENVGFYFSLYKENENFIVVVESCLYGKLIAISKANKKRHAVGKVYYHGEQIEGEPKHIVALVLLENVVYFQTYNRALYRFKIEDNSDGYVKTELLMCLDDNILSVCNTVCDKINILLNNGDIHTYSFTDRSSEKFNVEKEKFRASAKIGSCKSFGFSWNSVSKWLCTKDQKQSFRNNELWKESAIYVYGKILFVRGSTDCVLKIYLSTYTYEWLDLKKIFEIESTNEGIEQVEVVAMLNSHKVIVMMKERICVLEFVHGSHEQMHANSHSESYAFHTSMICPLCKV